MAARKRISNTQRFLRPQSGRYKNPYFGREERKKSGRAKKAAVLAVLLAAAGSLLYGPWLRIGTVEVEGGLTASTEQLRSLANEQLRSRRYLVLPQSNLFAFDSQRFVAEAEHRFGADVEVKKRAGRLVVSLAEGEAAALWGTGGQHYYVDRNGTVIALAADGQVVVSEGGSATVKSTLTSSGLPTLVDRQGRGVVRGDSVPVTLAVGFAVDLDRFARTTLGLSVSRYEVNELNDRELRMVTAGGWEVLLDPGSDLTQQALNLQAAVEEVGRSRADLEYIDVRFGEKVFYR